MAITPIRALLFLAGGLAAVGATAYVSGALDPYLAKAPPAVASLPAPATEQKTARLSTEAAPATATPAPPAAGTAPAATEVPAETEANPTAPAASDAPATETASIIPPSFDVVRVEPNGSIVIAGNAAAGANVEIVTGSNVIGKAVAGPAGDFAVVLDKPLEPGGYQIVLRSTAPDNLVAMSVETAVVSVPESEDGQVLALVEEPGKPAEMISVPEPKAPAPVEQTTNESAAEETAPAEQATSEPTAEEPAPAEQATNEPAAEEPAVPEPSTAGQMAAVEQPGADEPAVDEPAAEGSSRMEAALAPQPEVPAPAAEPEQPAEQPPVAVEAVEIEGRTIFVAGRAEPGSRLRGYANEILIGDAVASAGGRFLIEAERDLPVGDYIIRVDVLEADGVKVAARAAVPFEREPGEAIAAVAPPAAPETPAAEMPAAEAPPAAAVTPSSGAQTAEGPAGEAAAPVAPPAVAEAPPASAPPATAEAPVAEAPAPAEPASPSAQNAGETEVPATGHDGAVAEAPAVSPAPASEPIEPETDMAAAEAGPAESGTGEEVAGTPPVAAAQPGTTAAPTDMPSEAPAVADASAPADMPAEAAAPEPATQADVAVAEAPADGGTQSPGSGAETPTVTAPKLQNVDGAVIIRRGDTLWRISRRVYGRGIRYSTIYLANQEQIEDPDRIWPGQVFTVPEKTQEGVAADLTKLGDQVTTLPQ